MLSEPAIRGVLPLKPDRGSGQMIVKRINKERFIEAVKKIGFMENKAEGI